MNRLILLFIIVGMIVLTAFFMTQRSLGSVNDSSSAYESTTTRSSAGVNLPTSVLSLGFGTLGSVIVTGPNSGIINFYDGTTTTSHADSATTTIAIFPSGMATGTYTFDAKYVKGLIIETSGLNATATVTWKK